MEALALAIMGAVNILCFVVGAKVGQATKQGVIIDAPTLNPITAHRFHKETKETREEQERLSILLQNIENYDGSSIGQREVK